MTFSSVASWTDGVSALTYSQLNRIEYRNNYAIDGRGGTYQLSSPLTINGATTSIQSLYCERLSVGCLTVQDQVSLRSDIYFYGVMQMSGSSALINSHPFAPTLTTSGSAWIGAAFDFYEATTPLTGDVILRLATPTEFGTNGSAPPIVGQRLFIKKNEGTIHNITGRQASNDSFNLFTIVSTSAAWVELMYTTAGWRTIAWTRGVSSLDV